ncbi:MAG: hypothetical protein U0W24_20530 [Bacteroidales bacterium]
MSMFRLRSTTKGTIKAPYENLNEPKKPNANNEALNENTACNHNN